MQMRILRSIVSCLFGFSIVTSGILGVFPSTDAVNAELPDRPRTTRPIVNPGDDIDLENLLVKYKGSDKFELIRVDSGSRTAVTIQNRSNRQKASIRNKRKRLEQKFTELLNREDVEYVQPQYIYTVDAWSRSGDSDTPNDFDITPSPSTGNHWYYDLAGVRKMWQDQDCFNSGAGCGGNSNVIVAVIDTGLAFEDRTSNLPDGDVFYKNDDMFNGASINLFVNAGEIAGNEEDDDFNGFIDDVNGANTAEFVWCTYFANPACDSSEWAETGHPNDDGGHGTYVTGLISSLVDNALGSVSPAHNVTILPIKASFYHSGSFGTLELIEAIDYAVVNGADVINMSLAGPSSDAGLEAKLDWAEEQGVVVVAATGNTNTNVYYPAATDSVIAAGASTSAGNRAFYSNYGTELDITAYVGDGGGVGDTVYQRSYTCFFNSPNCYVTNDYSTFSNGFGIGTSYASPQVTALAALLISTKPTITKQGIENKMYENAIDLGTAGWDSETGWGAIDFGATYFDVANNSPPSLTVVEPDGVSDTADTSFLITWTDSDADNDAYVNFYRDTDGSGFDGTLLTECSNIAQLDVADSCVFDTRVVPDGNYYIYGCITDYIHPESCDYGGGPVTVSHTTVRDWGVAAVGDTFTDVSFTQTFSAPPAVVAEISSENGGDKAFPNIKDVTATGFKVQVLENTASGWDGSHVVENISWYAVQSNTLTEKIGFANIGNDWTRVNFLNSFAGTPHVFAMTQTEYGQELAYVDMRGVFSGGFDVRIEEPEGLDGSHVTETIGWIAFEDQSVADEGTAVSDDSWKTVNFSSPFSEPPALVLSIKTEIGSEKVYPDVQGLTNTGFQFRMEEDPKVQDGIHVDETINWAAFPITTPDFDSGKATVDSSWSAVNFNVAFDSVPKVFADINTEKGTDTAGIDIKQVTQTGFSVRIEEDMKAGWDGNHVGETITWLAIKSPPGTEELGATTVDNSWKTVNFGSAFSSIPKVFVEIQTENGGDTVAVDIKDVTTASFQLRLEEDVRVGWDGTHTDETVAWLAFESTSIGSSGSEVKNDSWSPFTYGPFSGIPMLLSEINTENGAETAQIDMRSVSPTWYSARVEEEPNYYDKTHVDETLVWLAWE